MPTAKKEVKKVAVKKVIEKKVNSSSAKLMENSSESSSVNHSGSRIKTQSKTNHLVVPMFSLAGNESGNLDLPETLFGQKVNQPLIAQAIRVYVNNQTAHYSHTKTRGEVSYSTKKVWRQKGTGRARHGSRKAPVWVGGGIALGARSRKTELELPKKMKKAALISALSDKALKGEILGVDLDKMSGKTAEVRKLINKLGKKGGLLLTSMDNTKAISASRNLVDLTAVNASQVNVYQIIKSQTLILTKQAVAKLEERFALKEIKK